MNFDTAKKVKIWSFVAVAISIRQLEISVASYVYISLPLILKNTKLD